MANPNLEASWLELSEIGCNSISRLIKQPFYQPRQLLGLRGQNFYAAITAISEVISDVLNREDDPDLPATTTVVRDRRGDFPTTHLSVASITLSEAIRRPGLGLRYDVLIFARPKVTPIDKYEEGLHHLIRRTNEQLRNSNISQIPSLRAHRVPLDGIKGLEDIRF